MALRSTALYSGQTSGVRQPAAIEDRDTDSRFGLFGTKVAHAWTWAALAAAHGTCRLQRAQPLRG